MDIYVIREILVLGACILVAIAWLCLCVVFVGEEVIDMYKTYKAERLKKESCVPIEDLINKRNLPGVINRIKHGEFGGFIADSTVGEIIASFEPQAVRKILLEIVKYDRRAIAHRSMTLILSLPEDISYDIILEYVSRGGILLLEESIYICEHFSLERARSILLTMERKSPHSGALQLSPIVCKTLGWNIPSLEKSPLLT